MTPDFYAEMKDKLYGMVLRQLRYHEDRLDPMRVLDNPSGRALLRETSGMLHLWRVCENSACRRARKCRRDRAACVVRFAPLVPSHMRADVIERLREKLTRSLHSHPRLRGEGWGARLGEAEAASLRRSLEGAL